MLFYESGEKENTHTQTRAYRNCEIVIANEEDEKAEEKKMVYKRNKSASVHF